MSPVRAGRRLACRVPFCTNSRGDRKNNPLPEDLAAHEWICARHWRGVPAALRRAYGQTRRRESQGARFTCTNPERDEAGWPHPAGSAGCTCPTCQWVVCRTRAIQAAAGL